MAETRSILKHSDVVFMYASDSSAYKAYDTTFVAWGGANTPEEVQRHHELGIRCTGSMWCLTARPKPLYEHAELRAAAALDIEGKPIEVPWLFSHTYKGQRAWFGCTNSPAFRQHVRQRVRKVMKGGADGLHVDDHLGVAAAMWFHGGGLCDHCIGAFREFLKRRARPGVLRKAGVKNLDAFDYRRLIRTYARTRRQYIEIQDTIPLMRLFKRFHVEAAAENVRQLGKVATEAAGHPVLLSANAPTAQACHSEVLQYLTHIVCEVEQSACQGTRNVSRAVRAYRAATRVGKELAATAAGWDWAWVKATGAEDLVRFWIALAYAHGQWFMVPHPKRQWCFTKELGSHSYEAPVEAYAPVYQFIRHNARYFDSLQAVEGAKIASPGNVLCRLRRKGDSGITVLHVLNRDYDESARRMRPRKNITIRIPTSSLAGSRRRWRLLSYEAAPQTVESGTQDGAHVIELPTLRLWSLLVSK